jgi:hypothetical protein
MVAQILRQTFQILRCAPGQMGEQIPFVLQQPLVAFVEFVDANHSISVQAAHWRAIWCDKIKPGQFQTV